MPLWKIPLLLLARRRCLPRATLLLVISSVAFFSLNLAKAANVPTGFVDRQIYSGFVSPTAVHLLPDGRVLVLEQNGVVRIVRDDTLLSAPFYTVPNVDVFVETGCLGVTSDPDFMSNGHVYLYCTIREGDRVFNRILRVTAQGDGVVEGSARAILDLPTIPPDPLDGSRIYTHLGAPMQFGADGKLYVAVGGHENSRVSPPENSYSQRMDSPFGKLLRINPDGSFPADNPFYNTAGVYPGIYSSGLRNPFGMDIQRNTGRIFINDVGAGSYEEIIDARPRENYGWPFFEGNSSDARFTNGIYVYAHENDSAGRFRCAVTGGAFYDPLTVQFPGSYVGKYLFADYCAGTVSILDPATPTFDTEFISGMVAPVGLTVSPEGSLYYLARHTTGTVADGDGLGLLGKVEYTGTQLPRLSEHPTNQTAYIGTSVTFRVVQQGATSIQWQRNGANIPGATSAAYTLSSVSEADSGAEFRAVLQNAFGTTTSNTATLTVTDNRLPQASIIRPEPGEGYGPEVVLEYSGSASDAEDGTLPPSAFTWQANFHHDTHTHPFFSARTGSLSGSATVPDFEATTANTWMRFMLTVQDSAGQSTTVTRDLYPRHQLGSLRPSGTPTNGVGPIEVDQHNGGPAGNDGEQIALGGISYPKGLGVHAPSSITYRLNGVCEGNLIADVGIDDSVGNGGSVVFRVLVDGVPAFDSGIMRGGDGRRAVNVNLTGAREVSLEVTDAGDGNESDRANWGGARLACPALPEETRAPNSGGGAPISPPLSKGGGGCSMGGDGRFDPALLGLMLASLVYLLRRRMNRRS